MKRIKVRLTDTRINDFHPEEEAWLYDTESHLAVRAAPLKSGDCSKTYYFLSTLAYKIIRASFGDVRVVALPDARDKALKWQKWIEEGKDPREVIKDEERRQEAEELARLAAAQAVREEQAELERLEQGVTDLLALQIREKASYDARLLEVEARAAYFRARANYEAATAAKAPDSFPAAQ